MQYLRKLNIFQVYRKLPCIIYKQTYLIPQQPFPALNAESTNAMNLDPAKVSVRRSEKSVKEDAAYQQQIIEYKNKYILPIGQLKKKESIAIKLFLEEQGDKPSALYDNKPIKSLIIGQITKVYKSLPQQVRDSYETRAEVTFSQMKKQKDEFDAKHKIPEFTKMTNKQYYKSQMKLLFDKKSIPKFSSLSKKYKKAFIEECQLINKKSKEELQIFLGKHSLSFNQFVAITEICEAAERCAVLFKKFKDIQKKKIEQLSKVTKNGGEYPDVDINRGVEEQMKKNLKLLEGLQDKKLQVIAKIIGFKVENEQVESKATSQAKVQEKDKQQVKADSEKKVEQKAVEKEAIKVQTAQTKQEIRIAPASQKVQVKKTEPQSPIVPANKEQKEQKSQKPSKDDTIAQAKIDFPNQENLQKEYSDVLQDLKDENLNDLNIIDEDYEVHKINELMEKVRQLKLSKQDVKS